MQEARVGIACVLEVPDRHKADLRFERQWPCQSFTRAVPFPRNEPPWLRASV